MPTDAPAAPPANAAPAAPPAAPAAPAQPPAQQPPAAPPAQPPAAAPKDEGTILGGKPTDGEPVKPAAGAPEKYADFKLPEGMVADPKLMEGFGKLAKETNLSQDAAQKFVDLQTQYAKETYEAAVADGLNQIKKWGEESKTFFGAEFDKQAGLARKAIERIGNPKLSELLNTTGLGNHKDLIAAFAFYGQRISEDQPVDGKPAGGDQKSDAELLYGKTMGVKKQT